MIRSRSRNSHLVLQVLLLGTATLLAHPCTAGEKIGSSRSKGVPPPPKYPDPTPGQLGNAEREAQDLLQETLDAIDRASAPHPQTDKIGEMHLRSRIFQGIGDADNSYGTHYADGYHNGKLYGAAVDLSVRGLNVDVTNVIARRLRQEGLAAYRRGPIGTPELGAHIHLLDPIAPNLHGFNGLRLDKYAQVQQFLVGLDATAKRHRKEINTPIQEHEKEKVQDRLNHKLPS